MRVSRFAPSLAVAFLVLTAPALADHPGAGLDEAMQDREKYFQPVDEPAAGFELADAGGNTVRLSDLSEKIVVLNFVFASCGGVCPLHSDLIARIQEMINATPMKDIVQFVTVTTDPDKDTPEVLKAYGAAHGLDPVNWTFLTTRPGQPEDATRGLAADYGLRFDPLDDGQQMHGVVTHVIDRGGRLAAKFHGLQFEPVNLVSYVNGLVNAERPHGRADEPGLWQRMREWF